MPRLKAVHEYPEEYYSLCQRAHSGNAPVTLKFTSRAKARSFRVEMYQFRTALRKALLASPDSKDLQLAVLFAEGLEFSITDTNLIVRKKDTVHAQTIREQL